MNMSTPSSTDIIIPDELAHSAELSRAYRAANSELAQGLIRQLAAIDPNLFVGIAHAHGEQGGFRPLGPNERSVEIDGRVHFEPITEATTGRVSVAWRVSGDPQTGKIVACGDCSTHGCGEGGDGTGDGVRPDVPGDLVARGKTAQQRTALPASRL